MAVPARVTSANTAALWILAVLAVLFFLRSASSLLIPVALATLISYALEPIVGWLERHRIPRLAGAALVLIVVVGAIGLGAYGVRQDAGQLVQSLPKAVQRAREIVSAQMGASPAMQQMAEQLGVANQAGGGPGTRGTAGREGAQDERAREGTGTAPAEAAGSTGAIDAGSLVQRGVSAVFRFTGNLVVIFFLVYFLLISGGHIRDRLIEIAGDHERRKVTATVISEINAQIQKYLLVLLFTAVIVGLATWAVLAWLGVEHAAMWGMLAGLFNSIPYFGPVIVSGGLFAVGLVQGGGLTQALQMSGAAIVITSLEGWLLTPPLMGRAERMSPLVVFLGLLLWTWLWGGWGTILAVPMLVVVKSVADHVDRLKPVGRLMAP